MSTLRQVLLASLLALSAAEGASRAVAAAPSGTGGEPGPPSSAAMPGMGAAAKICPAGPPRLPPELAGWASRTRLAAAPASAGLGAAALTVGRGVDATLAPATAVAYAAAPGKPPAPGGWAGLLSLTVTGAGTYAVGLSSAAWIDVVDARGATVASAAHGHGPPCSGVRKVVDFALQPGSYVVQLTSTDPVVGVLVFRR